MRTLWQFIIKLFKWTWRLLNFIRNLTINIFFIFLVLIFAGICIQISNSIQTKNIGYKALLLNISGIIVDKPSNKNKLEVIWRQLFGIASDRLQENSLFDIVETIRQAKEDNNITGIVLDLKNFVGAAQSSMQYVGKALREFRDSGKPVIAIGNSYSQNQYYLASFANKIWLSENGAVDLHGFVTNNLYYRSLLNKLKVTTHIFRVGIYKSAVEPFMRDNMSKTAHEVDGRWLNELWSNYLKTVSENRKITSQQLFPGAKVILDSLRRMGGNTAKYALNKKLVDNLGSSLEIENALIKQFGCDKKNKNLSAISFYDYAPNKMNKKGDGIAVIFVNGVIMDGKEKPGYACSNTIMTQIRDARLNPKIKAIILRINSPGGSVSASEMIRMELAAARTVGKPIVVSMGGVAASGGYWISTPADYIIANQSTLTGSIGIFGVINTIENSLDYLGIHTDGVSTSPLADVSVTKPLPSEVLQMMQLNIESSYKHFIEIVAQSRKSTPDKINKIAQGCIWTGKDAKINGLVDSIGDFDDAIVKAAELAGLKQWYVDYYQDRSIIFDMILDNIYGLLHSTLITFIHVLPLHPLDLLISIASEENKNIQLVVANDSFNSLQNCYAFCLKCDEVY